MEDAALATADPAPAPPRRPAAELGRKGAETRRRLMAAACELLQTMSPVALTATGVARKAQTSSATFYVYFDDVADVVYALAREANDDLDVVMAALDRWRNDPASDGAADFLAAFREHWHEHRAILSIRNMEADRGDARFMQMRSEAGIRIITALADLMRSGGGPEVPARREAMSRAIVIYAAIERLAATEGLYPRRGRDLPSFESVFRAQIEMLTALVNPARKDMPA